MTRTAARTFRPDLTRRRVMTATAALATFTLGAVSFMAPMPAEAQRRPAGPSEVPMEELMKPIDGLKDIVLGDPNAKVAIVEYASMTCGHCSHFHKENFPKLKEKYIDTGKVSYVMREFPLDNLAAAASMLARCAPNGKNYEMADMLFNTQADWAFVQGNPVPKLFEIAKQAGFTQESFDTCLKDQKLLDQINAQRARASEQFGVSATPTFFINGKKLQGAPNVESFDAMIEPLLK
ncbi:MAG: DsbA family protein [Hyphomicrobiaceae bacterium]